jgi:very-short-patch-repair endonuclease
MAKAAAQSDLSLKGRDRYSTVRRHLQRTSPMNHKLVPAKNRTFAKSMRLIMTPAELKLWNAVRAGRLMDLKFRRQMPIASYIVDFACPSKKLIIELDGSQHGNDSKIVRDTMRTEALERLGWTVLRFWNDDVINDIEGVCQQIVIVAGRADNAMERS